MSSSSKDLVILVSITGDILTYFESDRDEFGHVAIYGRDRVFSLAFQGSLTSLSGMSFLNGMSVEGVIYQEVKPWRINTGSINKPAPRKRRRRSALILRFPNRHAGAA